MEIKLLNNGIAIDRLVDKINDSRVVLLGEASHGNSEYHVYRFLITKKLIEERGFTFVAVEGDWPECALINKYATRSANSPKDAISIMRSFQKFPTWIWANWEMMAFIQWLRRHNATSRIKVSFYGLDIYSLRESINKVIEFLKNEDPSSVELAKQALNCFDPFNRQPSINSAPIVPVDCQKEAIELLMAIKEKVQTTKDMDKGFDAVQNAFIVANAEKYYRSLISGGSESWNIRDRHMMETLERLMEAHGPESKAIVWAHNSHVGDARATNMSKQGMVNLGQLARGKYKSFTVGFGAYEGEVIAAKEWGAESEVMKVPQAKEGSWEAYFKKGNRIVFPEEKEFNAEKGHRAIGVVYHPEFEQFNYVPTKLGKRYDAFIFLERTTPIHPIGKMKQEKIPDLFPWGL